MSKLLKSFQELNLSNYGPDDVDQLNAWAIDAYAELAAIKAQEPSDHVRALNDALTFGIGIIKLNSDGSSEHVPAENIYAAPVSEAKAQGVVMPERIQIAGHLSAVECYRASGWNQCLDEVARLNAAPVQQVSVPDGFERYRLAEKFCEQRLVTDDQVRAIVVDAFASGYGFGIAASPAAPAADDDDIVLNANAQEILSQCIGAHAYVLGVLANGRPDLAFIEAKKWVDAFKKAAAQMEQGHD